MHTDEKRWNLVASRSENQLYTENRKIEEAIENLPGYSKTDSTFNLYTRTYIEWSLACQESDEAHMDKIAEDNNPINTLANVQLIYVIIALLALIVMGIISPGFIIYKQTGVLLGKTEQDEDLIASNGMRLISGILIVLILSFLISALFIISNFNSIVDYVEKNNCTDETTLEIFLFIRGVLQDAYDYNMYGLISVLIMTGCELIATLWLCILSCITNRNEKKDNMYASDLKKTR